MEHMRKLLMNYRFFQVLILSGLFQALFHSGMGQDLQRYNPNRELIEGIVIPNTELYKIHSEIADRDFLIYVQLPASYKNNPDKKYPVWYNTDANQFFPLMANASTLLQGPEEDMPEMIIIGIGYLMKGLDDWKIARTYDLTPVDDPETDRSLTKSLGETTGRKDVMIRSGGAPQFLEFIIRELIPDVESRYRALPDNRSLGGYAFGGMFTLYALFLYPESFKNYFAGSPTLSFHEELLFLYENDFAEMHQDLKVHLFMTAGELEGENRIQQIKKMASRMISRNYPNLELDLHIFEDEDEYSCIGAAYMRAFRVLLSSR
jgi:uncharacterized protein